MPYICDGLSVGVLIFDDQHRLLMITRAHAPAGIAPVAGHVRDEHPDFTHVDAAVVETSEEVGLTVRPEDLQRVYIQWHPNRCGADIPATPVGHDWQVYYAKQWTGEVARSEEETSGVAWYTLDEVQALADRTIAYAHGRIPEEEWQASPGLEPMWVDILSLVTKPHQKGVGFYDTVVKVAPGVMRDVQALYAGPRPESDAHGVTSTVQYTGSGTKYLDAPHQGDFTYLDPAGRRITLDREELTVAEEGCTGVAEATVGLPDPGSEAALVLMRALMKAMGLDGSYEITEKQAASA